MAWLRSASTAARLGLRRSLLLRRPLHSSAVRRSPSVPLSRLTDSFLDSTSTLYLESLQRAWEADPLSVDESWNHFFRDFADTSPSPAPTSTPSSVQDSMRLLLLIRAYQTLGHRKAILDPLGINPHLSSVPAELDPALYGFNEADLDREFFIASFLSENRPVQTLRSIIARLEETYCGSTGFEYMHIADLDKRDWLRQRIESPPKEFTREQREVILDRLMWSTLVEDFFHTKWPSAKRFGIEGAEVVNPAMKAVIDKGAELGVESVVIGTGHRGRVSVLANIARVPFPHIFTLFGGGGAPPPEAGYAGVGDVKHHIGASYDKRVRNGKMVHLSVVANPSHLEAVDAVVLGKARAKQYYAGDGERSRVMPLMLHGDGSFAGQGVVAEALHLSGLPKYGSGGTVHVLNNNQVAFTTDPSDGRASHYCSDVAKALDAPVFHVNGDDVEAVIRACELAAEWRQTFHTDVVVDIFCYRRFGHNEIDEPFFTQPTLYRVIRNHPTMLELYQRKLIESGQFSNEDVERMHKKINTFLQEEFDNTKDYIPKKPNSLSASWAGLKSPDQNSHIRDTGVTPEVLRQVGQAITSIPHNFKPHKAVKKIYDQRAQSLETGEGIDWPLAEALAFGTLISEGNHVRLSGQDVERGTFSHRHAVIHDQETGEVYYPLGHVNMNQNKEMFAICNSSLSEFAVLAFELGYSMENPHSLVLWEAQFGDFANGGQVIIDNFLSSGEAKWLRQTGLVMLLPHGYDGQGAEHSSSRLERFLQMSDDDPDMIPEMDPSVEKQIQECNWQVVNVTTPANYFHVLRRQIHRDFRKPLIVMSPKNLLRHKDCKSHLSEFDDVIGHPELDKQGTQFKRLIEDQNGHKELEEGISRLILCSGKVYYELDEERKKKDRKDVAICRVEQICPFPYDLIQQELKRYPRAEIVWCQEEPKNMGAYSYVARRLYTAMKAIDRGSFEDIKYVGRRPSAAPATGFYTTHVQQQAELITKAMQFDPISDRVGI